MHHSAPELMTWMKLVKRKRERCSVTFHLCGLGLEWKCQGKKSHYRRKSGLILEIRAITNVYCCTIKLIKSKVI